MISGSYYREKRDGKAGCLPVLLVGVLLAVLAAWYLGYIDRWMYETSLNRSGEISRSSSAFNQQAEDAPAIDGARVGQPQEPYVYSRIGEEDQMRYRIVLAALETRESQLYPEDDMDSLQRIFQYVQADHPELFYVSGVSMETVRNGVNGLVERVSVKGRFSYSEGEASAIAARIEAAATECLAGVPEGADDYAKAKYLYEWLAANVAYDSETAAMGTLESEEDAHNMSRTIEGPLLRGLAVCGGYAGAFQYLMEKAGVQTTFITGLGDGGAHAWCLSLLDGNYYYVDPTWADPQSEGGSGELGYTNYDYLNITTGDLQRTHVPQSDFPLPDCTAWADNYYVRENLLFDWPDEQRFGELAAESCLAGRPLQIRCADDAAFRDLADFVSSGRIGAYIPSGYYRYSASEETQSIVMLW